MRIGGIIFEAVSGTTEEKGGAGVLNYQNLARRFSLNVEVERTMQHRNNKNEGSKGRKERNIADPPDMDDRKNRKRQRQTLETMLKAKLWKRYDCQPGG